MVTVGNFEFMSNGICKVRNCTNKNNAKIFGIIRLLRFPCCYGMARSWFAVGVDGLQLWNKQSRTADKGWT
jgi:hypothetical protein